MLFQYIHTDIHTYIHKSYTSWRTVSSQPTWRRSSKACKALGGPSCSDLAAAATSAAASVGEEKIDLSGVWTQPLNGDILWYINIPYVQYSMYNPPKPGNQGERAWQAMPNGQERGCDDGWKTEAMFWKLVSYRCRKRREAQAVVCYSFWKRRSRQGAVHRRIPALSRIRKRR